MIRDFFECDVIKNSTTKKERKIKRKTNTKHHSLRAYIDTLLKIYTKIPMSNQISLTKTYQSGNVNVETNVKKINFANGNKPP